ncbi:hypothetical protein F4775DRAFT_576504 [Biscogniauxia sp. FL1348]|nr:hypothetical protein F4775DRAFT_576504 [Biscogniauxia sp. FL1348]
MAHKHDSDIGAESFSAFELTGVSHGSSRHDDQTSLLMTDEGTLAEEQRHRSHSASQTGKNEQQVDERSASNDTDGFLAKQPPEIPAQKDHSNSGHGYFSAWLWEAGAVCVSIFCTVAIVAILSTTSGKALSDWHFPIAPNSLVSVFSTLAKSALMVSVASCLGQLKWIYFSRSSHELYDFEVFEEASRGPWGALTFVWFIKFRARLALFGSIITLVALAFEPFTQQILEFPSRIVAHPDQASFGIANAYDSGVELAKTKTVFDLPIDAQIQGAIMSGLYNVDAPVKVACPTGNCAWPPFTTMALSSSCHNATLGTSTNCTLNGASMHCTYITPGGYNLSASASFGNMGSTYVRLNSSARSEWDRYADWANSTLVEFAIVNLTDIVDAQGVHNVQYRTPYVVECDMKWYARTFYDMKVVNGTFIPGTTEDHGLVGVPVESTSDNQALEYWYPGPYDYYVANASDDMPSNLTFSINPNDHGIIAGHLQEVFSSNSGDDFGMALMQSSDLVETIQNITTSVTYALGHGKNATTISGTTFTDETYIRVRWEWLLLPIWTVLMSAVLLLATVIHSRRRKVAGWKSSSLLSLFTRFDGWKDDSLIVHSPRDMRRRAHEMTARFGIMGGPVLKRWNGSGNDS